MLNVSVVMVIVPGAVLAVPPSTPDVMNVLSSTTSLAASVDSGRIPEIVMVPVGPAVSPGSLFVMIYTALDPPIGVSSGFVFPRSVLTLSAICPAGAGPIVLATIFAALPPPGVPSLVSTKESAVMVIADGVVAAVPPKTLELIEVSFRRTLVAVVPGPRTPWMVILPAGPAPASALLLSLAMKLPVALFGKEGLS